MSESQESTTEKSSRNDAIWLWFFFSYIVIVAISWTANLVPVVFKKIGLFSLAQGAISGICVAFTGHQFSIRTDRMILLIAFLIVLGGLICIPFWMYPDWIVAQKDRIQSLDPTTLIQLEQLKNEPPVEDPEEQRMREEFRAQVGQSLQEMGEQNQQILDELTPDYFLKAYLTNRVKPTGIKSVGLAILFWIVEVMASAFLGMMLFRKFLTLPPLPSEHPTHQLKK